jgi:hypothetical protein
LMALIAPVLTLTAERSTAMVLLPSSLTGTPCQRSFRPL